MFYYIVSPFIVCKVLCECHGLTIILTFLFRSSHRKFFERLNVKNALPSYSHYILSIRMQWTTS